MSTHGGKQQTPNGGMDRLTIRVSSPVYDRLTAIKLERQKALDRQVSYAEVIEQLLERQP